MIGPENANISFRPLLERDLPEIARIERLCFDDPWPTIWFQEAIRNKDHCSGAFDIEDRIVGYAIAFMEDNFLHLANLAIDPIWRRHGIAKMLVEEVIFFAQLMSVQEIYLEVRRSNLSALILYQSIGFSQTGVEKNYYQGEDALILTLEINGVV